MANDDLTFTLSLEAQQFTTAAQAASAAVQKMSTEATEAVQKVNAKTEAMTERMQEAAKRIGDLDHAGAGLSSGRLERGASGTADAMDRLGGSANKAAGGLDRAAKAGLAMEGLKALVEPLSGMIGELGPKTETAINGIQSTLTAAAGGFAIGGPIGAAVTGGIAALKGLWDYAHAAGEEQLRTAQLAAEAQDMLNRKVQEHAQLLREAQAAAADHAQSIITGNVWQQDAPRRTAADREAERRKRDLEFERERLTAADLPPAQRVAAERELDKRAVRHRYDDQEQAMTDELALQREREARISDQRRRMAEQLQNLPPSADIQRGAMATKIANLDKELESLTDAITKGKWRLEQFRENRSSMVLEEDRNIDLRRDREVKGVEAADYEERVRIGERDRRAQEERRQWFADRDDKRRSEAAGLVNDIADLDTSRGGGSGTTRPRRPGTVRGAVLPGSFQWKNGKKVMGQTGGGDDDDDASADSPRTVRGAVLPGSFQWKNGKKVKASDPTEGLMQKGAMARRAAQVAAKDPTSEETLQLLRAMKESLETLVRKPDQF